MTPHTPAAQRRRWVLLVAAVLLLAVGAASTRWLVRRPAPAVPPLPADIQDAEVRAALERARQAVLDKPNDAYGWGYLGMTLEAHLYETEADRCFAEAARLDPNDIRWPYFRALHALKHEPDNAVPLLRQAASTRSKAEDLSAVRLRLAETLLERHDLDEAEELFRAEVRRQPDNPRAALGLGLCALARGDEQAARLLSQPSIQNSKSARKQALAQRAALAWDRGDTKAAAECAKATAALPDDLPWPDPFAAEFGRLQVGRRGREREVTRLEQQGHYAEAAQAYLRQVEEQPTARAYVGAGINLAHLGEYDQALRWLREGVRRDPNSSRAHYCLAVTQFSRAETEWQRSPGSPQAKEWFRETVEQACRTAELKPDHALAYLIWGVSLKYLGEPAAAVAPLRKGVACSPVDADLQYALGDVLLETGNSREAAIYLENARQLNPTDPRLPQALERLKKRE